MAFFINEVAVAVPSTSPSRNSVFESGIHLFIYFTVLIKKLQLNPEEIMNSFLYADSYLKTNDNFYYNLYIILVQVNFI